MSNKSYYSHLMPQTAFRDSVKQGKAIQLKLTKLKIKDQLLKNVLKERINEEDNNILKVLIPDEMVENVKKDGHLEQIFQDLGL